MNGNISALKLHIMESTECTLQCPGCYLKNDIEKGYQEETIFEKYFKARALDEIGSAFYLNNLDRNPDEVVKKYEAKLDTFRPFLAEGRHIKKLLVTDSISASKHDVNKASFLNTFDELWASCRTLSSVKHLINSQDYEWNFLFTVGTDAEAILAFLYDIPEAKVELNIRKPYSFSDLLKYQNYQQIGMKLKAKEKIAFDNCMRYKLQKRNCAEPQGFVELTTFLDTPIYYTCAYSTNTCNCKMK